MFMMRVWERSPAFATLAWDIHVYIKTKVHKCRVGGFLGPTLTHLRSSSPTRNLPMTSVALPTPFPARDGKKDSISQFLCSHAVQCWTCFRGVPPNTV